MNLIDEVESIFPKKKPQAEVPDKKTRGPYKKTLSKQTQSSENVHESEKQGYSRGPYKKSNLSSQANQSSSERSLSLPKRKQSYQRGPYKKKQKADVTETTKTPKTNHGGPKRGPNTMEALHRDYPQVYHELSETCYTCGLPLIRTTRKPGEQVVRCSRCKQVDIHVSCFEN